jgi:pyrimidine-nucleoside phosphorylase
MFPQDVIRKKRDGRALSHDEIAFFVRGVTTGSWADYQVSALLMACFLNGMSPAEQQALTEEMLRSGERLDFSDIPLVKADKHSTGGVGDKTSLVLAPVAAAAGLCVPMISGRGLGHTGGTLDKLEAIPGFRVNLSTEEFRAVLRRVGFAMMGQTAAIAPADRRLYALRDATATVEAIPLIVGSIMSKKLAAGLDVLVLDVKTGSGAFMRDEEKALQLARALVETGNSFGVRTLALITDMNQPLGRAVGNALETRECLDILRGDVCERTRAALDLSLELSARMVLLASRESSLESARLKVRRALDSGAALERFRACVEAQGGDARVCDHPARLLPSTLRELKVESPRAGFVTRMDATEIGHAVGQLGGGRVRVDDEIDSAVGYLADARIGDELVEGEPLGLLYYHDAGLARDAAARIQAAYTLEDAPVEPPQLIKEVITA